jgi:hypothetical protein
MDGETRVERPALAKYRQTLDSGDLADLALHREQAVREFGERMHQSLDALGIGPFDDARLEVARLAAGRRELLRLLGPDLLEQD